MTTDEIQQAIASNNVSVIQSVKGIGVKTAQRVLVDLRDKISKTYAIDEVYISQSNTIKNEALSALEVLGFNRKQVEKVVDKILLEDKTVSVEVLIKNALKNL
jgi:Holliday junction DNA helicase RuvA